MKIALVELSETIDPATLSPTGKDSLTARNTLYLTQKDRPLHKKTDSLLKLR